MKQNETYNVEVTWPGALGDPVPGTIKINGDQMILEIPYGTQGTYHVEGHKRNGAWAGKGGFKGEEDHVRAWWAKVMTGVYVGIWTEEQEWMFKIALQAS
jgi:hypothetical protein